MRTSENIIDLLADLLLAQKTISNPPGNQSNTAFAKGKNEAKYADLASLRDATIDQLTQHNLVIIQTTEFNEAGQFVLKARLYHKTGQWIECEYPLSGTTSHQIGSAITYGRRYTWSALLGVYCDKDDDGNNAAGVSTTAPAKTNGKETYAQAMNPYHKPGGPSEYVSRAPGQLLESLLKECETIDEVDEWWRKHYKSNQDKINHGTQCQLMENMLHKGVETAADPRDLTRFWTSFVKDVQYLATMKPAEIAHLQDLYEKKVDQLGKFTPLDAG